MTYNNTQFNNTDKNERLAVFMCTRNRPEAFDRAVESIDTTLADPANTSLWVYVDEDDNLTRDYIASDKYQRFSIKVNWLIHQRQMTMGRMANTLYKNCTDNPAYIAAWVDDYQMRTQGWDNVIRESMKKFTDKIVLGYIPDSSSRRKDQLVLPVFTSKWADTLGRIYTEYFPFWHDDTWVDEIALMLERKLRLDIDAGPVGKPKGSTRIKNVFFWKRFFDLVWDQRLENARKLIAQISPPGTDEYQQRCRKALRIQKDLQQFRAGADEKYLLELDKYYVGNSNPQNWHNKIIHTATESIAVSKLLEKVDIYLTQNRHEDALEILDVITRAGQQFDNINYLRALCLQKLNRDEQALQAILSELNNCPDHDGAAHLFAESSLIKNFNEAAQMITSAVTPQTQQKIKELNSTCDKLLTKFPNVTQLKHLKASLLTIQNHLGQAEQILQQIIKTTGPSVNILNDLGLIQLRQNHTQKAVNTLMHAHKLQPQNPAPVLNLYHALIAAGQIEQANEFILSSSQNLRNNTTINQIIRNINPHNHKRSNSNAEYAKTI